MKKVFIIILNYNGKKDTLECLRSLRELRIMNYELRIVVIDNGSTDGSVEEIKNETLRRSLPRVKSIGSGRELKIIENKKNLGFAAGNNVGIRYALENGADWVVILNNDTTVPQDFLDLLQNEADIVGPVIKFKRNGRWIYDYGGYLNWWIGRPKHHELPYYVSAEVAHQRFFRFPILSRINADFNPNSSSLARETLKNRVGPPRFFYSCHPLPDYLSGCCLLIKRVVFEKIRLFDERFFLYFEDLDFCLRAKNAGFKIALEPKVVIFHKLGGTVGRFSKTAIFHNLRSNFIFITKYLGWRRPIGYLYLTLLSIKILVDKSFG